MENNIHSLFSPDKRAGVKPGELPEEVLISRESAIRSGKVAIMAFSGLNSEMAEYMDDGRECWQREPVPILEKRVVKDNAKDCKAFEISIWGKEKLWKHMEATAEILAQKTGKKMDLKMLTPYEAANLVGLTLKRKVKYEDLIGDKSAEELFVFRDSLTTSRPDIMKLYGKDSIGFEDEVKGLKEKIDKMPADVMIEGGFGVCRHVAAAAQAMYGLLKERQEGILLNGTYMLYHGEEIGKQGVSAVVGNHAYNVLLVTSPTGEMNMSVLDPTRILGDEEDDDEMDQTWCRISQACSFFREYGKCFGLKNVDQTVIDLASKGHVRLRKYFEENKMPFYKEVGVKGIETLLGDYVALIEQSEIGKRGETLKYVLEYLESLGCTTGEAMYQILRLASFTDEYPKGRSIRDERRKEVSVQMEKVDFSKKRGENLSELGKILGKTIEKIDPEKMEILRDKEKISENSLIWLKLAGFFVRISVEQNIVPGSVKQMEVVRHCIGVAKTHKLKGNLNDFGEDFLNTFYYR